VRRDPELDRHRNLRHEPHEQRVPPPNRDRPGHDRGRDRGDESVAARVVAQPDLELAGSEQNGRNHAVDEDTIDARKRPPKPGSR
jgi:hypothetical protein